MTKYFIANPIGFLDSSINVIPKTAVEITDDKHKELLNGQSTGKIISADAEGYPILIDPPAPTAEQLQKQANSKARAYLASTDWYIVRKAETGVDVPEDVLTKRQEARSSIV